jgi:hypothetical protein
VSAHWQVNLRTVPGECECSTLAAEAAMVVPGGLPCGSFFSTSERRLVVNHDNGRQGPSTDSCPMARRSRQKPRKATNTEEAEDVVIHLMRRIVQTPAAPDRE